MNKTNQKIFLKKFKENAKKSEMYYLVLNQLGKVSKQDNLEIMFNFFEQNEKTFSNEEIELIVSYLRFCSSTGSQSVDNFLKNA